MRYEKPIVLDLSAGARATGQEPLGCYSGNAPGGTGLCEAGTGGTAWVNPCAVGPAPGGSGGDTCVSGAAASGGACISGAGGPSIYDTCTVGPSAQL